MPNRYSIFAAFLAAGLTGPAHASCVAWDDVSHGVHVEYEDLDTSLIMRDANGAITEIAPDGDGGHDHFISANGLLETAWKHVVPEGQVDAETLYDYSFDPAAMIPPVPGTKQGGKRTTLDADGTVVETVGFAVTIDDTRVLDLDGCTYQAVPFSTFSIGGGGNQRVNFLYINELGIPVLTGFSERDWQEEYTLNAIRRAP